MKTEALNADKTPVENLVKKLTKQNILIKEKLPEVFILLEYWIILIASPDQNLLDPPQIYSRY